MLGRERPLMFFVSVLNCKTHLFPNTELLQSQTAAKQGQETRVTAIQLFTSQGEATGSLPEKFQALDPRFLSFGAAPTHVAYI